MERHIGLHIIITFFFFSNICDYIKEGPVLLLLFLSPLIGPLKHGVCVCCFVLFVLSGCYVVLLCVKKKKNVDKKKDNSLFQIVLIERGFVMQSIILLYIKETDGRPADGAIQSRIG